MEYFVFREGLMAFWMAYTFVGHMYGTIGMIFHWENFVANDPTEATEDPIQLEGHQQPGASPGAQGGLK